MSADDSIHYTLFIQAKGGRLDLNLSQFTGVAETPLNITESIIMKGDCHFIVPDPLRSSGISANPMN